jgi:hypothetical protein
MRRFFPTKSKFLTARRRLCPYIFNIFIGQDDNFSDEEVVDRGECGEKADAG